MALWNALEIRSAETLTGLLIGASLGIAAGAVVVLVRDRYFISRRRLKRMEALRSCCTRRAYPTICYLSGWARVNQYTELFRAISPNGRIPAIVDHDAPGGPLAAFESGAILIYLAEKTGRFLPADTHGRSRGILGDVANVRARTDGRTKSAFSPLCAETLPYAIARYGKEVRRLYGVLDHQLRLTDDCVTGQYSIADIACFPWIMTHKRQGITLDDFGNLKRWFAALRARSALQRGLAVWPKHVAIR